MASTTVYETNNLKIKIWPRDHLPPHFHIVGVEFDFSVTIKTFEIIAGTYHRKANTILAWAKNNQDVLLSKWDEYHE